MLKLQIFFYNDKEIGFHIDIIEKFEKLLNRDSVNINMLMLFMTTTELNLEQIKLILKELKDFYSIFIV